MTTKSDVIWPGVYFVLSKMIWDIMQTKPQKINANIYVIRLQPPIQQREQSLVLILFEMSTLVKR